MADRILTYVVNTLYNVVQSSVYDVMSLCFLRSGLGYILGSSAKDVADDWHWALRVRASLSSARTHPNMHTKTDEEPFLQGLVVSPVMDLGWERSVVEEVMVGGAHMMEELA